MARRKTLTSEVRGLIRRVYLNNLKHKKKRTTEEVRNEVEYILRTDEENYGQLWPIPEKWPGLSIVQHEVGKFKEDIKKQSLEEKEQEEPWDMSTLGKYPIPPEVVPLVLAVAMSSEQPVTIREAKWLGRLASLLSTILAQQEMPPTIDYFKGIAIYYATSERISKLMGERVSPTMDKVLWEFLTRRESIAEVAKRGFNLDADAVMLTKEQWGQANKAWRKLGLPKHFGSGLSALGITLETKDSIPQA